MNNAHVIKLSDDQLTVALIEGLADNGFAMPTTRAEMPKVTAIVHDDIRGIYTIRLEHPDFPACSRGQEPLAYPIGRTSYVAPSA